MTRGALPAQADVGRQRTFVWLSLALMCLAGAILAWSNNLFATGPDRRLVYGCWTFDAERFSESTRIPAEVQRSTPLLKAMLEQQRRAFANAALTLSANRCSLTGVEGAFSDSPCSLEGASDRVLLVRFADPSRPALQLVVDPNDRDHLIANITGGRMTLRRLAPP